MKTIILFLMLITSLISSSQTTIKKSSIDSGGDSVTNGTTAVVYTIGEIAVHEKTTAGVLVSEGFLSAQTLFALGLDSYDVLDGISIYPNPTSGILNIDFFNTDKYNIQIFDILGKQITLLETDEINQQTIDMTDFSSGVYSVLITNPKLYQYKAYKIIRK